MHIGVAEHRLSLEVPDSWTLEPVEPGAEHLGIYLRSNKHGVYLNVRADEAATGNIDEARLQSLLREQNWGPSIDEWRLEQDGLLVVGGTFEASGIGDEAVLEVFVSNGRRAANLAMPGSRRVLAEVRSDVQRMAKTVRFD